MVEKTENLRRSKGTMAYWRSITKTIIILLRIYKEVVAFRLERR